MYQQLQLQGQTLQEAGKLRQLRLLSPSDSAWLLQQRASQSSRGKDRATQFKLHKQSKMRNKAAKARLKMGNSWIYQIWFWMMSHHRDEVYAKWIEIASKGGGSSEMGAKASGRFEERVLRRKRNLSALLSTETCASSPLTRRARIPMRLLNLIKRALMESFHIKE